MYPQFLTGILHFLEVHDCKIDSLLSRLVIHELNSSFDVFADTPVQTFDGNGSINDYLPDDSPPDMCGAEIFYQPSLQKATIFSLTSHEIF